MHMRDQGSVMANAIRSLAMDGVEKAKSGHPGLPMGAADVATVLFSRFMNFDPQDTHWPDRDRFILSAGHGSMLLYALLHLIGVESMTIDELKNFRQWNSLTPGHPEYGHTAGVEMTTGPLGQGISSSVGMALAERMMNARFGDALVDHYTYVLASDGDLMEGISQEAIALAGHLKLGRLVVLWDDNGISIDGPLSIADSVDQGARFASAGWHVQHVDGHDHEDIATAIEAARQDARPSLIACKTIIGFGAPKKAGTSKAHGEPLGAEELAAAKAALHLSPEPFAVDPDALKAWRAVGERGKAAHAKWQGRVEASDPAQRQLFERVMSGALPHDFAAAMADYKAHLFANPVSVATRKASEMALEAITTVVPELVPGSADLTPSNNTKVKAAVPVTASHYAGTYLHYGIREHGMAAAMNGMALHGGLIPAGATFMVFTDYCRPSIRLAALMGLRVIYVMTHDSIGLGEDGPTHQPVEHLAALRAIPNLLVMRPCDAVETAEAWEIALTRHEGPTLLALTRQNLKQMRFGGDLAHHTGQGAYEIEAAQADAQVSLFATGSEVEIASAAQALLSAKGIAARVVSVPCFELFAALPAADRLKVIGHAKVNVAIEAGLRMGWDAIIGSDGVFVGMTGFGASAPYKELYAHFGITAEAVVEQVMQRLH